MAHASTVPSRLDAYNVRPSGENATPFAAPAWPANVSSAAPVAGSHSVTRPSEPAVAAVLPLGEKATASAPPAASGPPAGVTWPVRRSTNTIVPPKCASPIA